MKNAREGLALLRRRPFSAFHFSLSTQRAFTLIEMLVVMAIIGMLAGMLAGIIIHARNVSLRVACSQNLNHIGQAVSLLVLSHNGLYPLGPTTDGQGNLRQDALSNAYPSPLPADPNPVTQNDSGFSWWARVFEQTAGDLGLLFAKDPATGLYLTNGATDASFNPNGHALRTELPSTDPRFLVQLPQDMQLFHCPMAGALDGSPAMPAYPATTTSAVANLYNSISYGINFDVKDSGRGSGTPPWPPLPALQSWPAGAQRPYNSSIIAPSTLTPYSPLFPSYLNAADKFPDQYRATEIQNPSQFILISEANTQGPEWIPSIIPPPPPPGNWSSSLNWTGGRISMGDTSGNGTGYERTSSDSPPNNSLIVGRHGGYANVLFADWHVEAMEVNPGLTTANMNINYNTPFWTLPGK